MPAAGILPDKSTAERFQKTKAPPERSAASFLTDNIQCHASAEHESTAHKMPTATDTPTHTAAVKGRISTATRSQVRNPVTAMASTFEKSQPRSSKPPKSLPVTGIATIPMNSASSHQVQNVHTSPPRRYAESTVRSTAAVSSGNNSLIFFSSFFCSSCIRSCPADG